MMGKCPKCGGSTKPYDGAGGASPRLAGGRLGQSSGRPSAENEGQQHITKSATTRAKHFNQIETIDDLSRSQASPSVSVHADIAALQEQLRERDRELAGLRAGRRDSPPRRGSPTQSSGLVASNQQELASAWSQHVQERQWQTEIAALRDKYQALIHERDRWTADKLRAAEEHHKAMRALEEHIREARNEAQQHQSRVLEMEAQLTDVQRKHYDAEQLVHTYAQRMQVATDEVRELQRAVSSSKESDRREIERARADAAAHGRRLSETEDELKHMRLRMADVKDELEATTALRASLTQKLNTLSMERDQLAEAKDSLERQLHLAGVEQQALAQEGRLLREKLMESNARIETLDAKRTELSEELQEIRASRMASTSSVHLSSELAALRGQLEASTAEVARVARERQAAVEAAEALRNEVRRLNSANAALDDEVTHARGSNELLAKELSTLRSEIRRIGQDFQSTQASQLAAQQKLCEELREDVRRAESNTRAAAEQVEKSQRDAEIMRVAHEKTRAELKSTIQALEAELSTRANDLDKAHAELQRKQSLSPTKVTTEATLAADRISNLTQSIERQQHLIQAARVEADDARREADESKRALAAVRTAAASTEEILAATLREVGNICTKEELPLAVRAFARERNIAVEEKEQHAAKAQRDAASLRDEIADLRGEVQRLGLESEKGHQRALAAERELRSFQVESEAHARDQTRRAELQYQAVLDDLRVQLSQSAQELKDVQVALQGTRDLHAQSEERLRLAEADKRRLAEQAQQAEERHANHMKGLDSARGREAELVRLLHHEQAKTEAMRSLETELREQIQALRADNIKLRRDTDTAAQMLASALEEERRMQEGDRERIERELEQARVQLKLERDRRSIESDVTRSAESRCLELQSTLEKVTQERDQLRREQSTTRGAHKATTDAFQARVTDLEAQTREQDSQLRDLVERLANRERDSADATGRVAELERCVQQLQAEKDEALRRLDSSSRRIAPPDAAYAERRFLGQTDHAASFLGASHPSSSTRLHSPMRESALRPPSGASGSNDMWTTSSTAQVTASYSAPPAQQSPVPQPLHGSRVVTSGTSARERNDALLAQFREQRALSAGAGHATQPQRTPSSSAGVRLGSLRRQ